MSIDAILRGAEHIVDQARKAAPEEFKKLATEIHQSSVALEKMLDQTITASQKQQAEKLLKKIEPSRAAIEQIGSNQAALFLNALKDFQSSLKHLHKKAQEDFNRKVSGKEKAEL